MFSKILLNSLNLIIFFCVYSFYNHFVLNIEVLLFFVFIFIFFNSFIYLYFILSDYLISKKNEILKEYFGKFFDFFYLVDLLKIKIRIFIKNLKQFFSTFKLVLNYYKILFFSRFYFIIYFFNYIFNNCISAFSLILSFIGKKYLSFFFDMRSKNFFLNKLYHNIFFKNSSFFSFLLKGKIK